MKTAHHGGLEGPDQRPELNGTYDINRGLRMARKLLLDLNNQGMPAATGIPGHDHPAIRGRPDQLGAIGARTTESQVHRELASGLSCPVGFKNGTDGNLKIAVDAIRAASQLHHFLSVTKAGHSAIVGTGGNPDCHVILRGGKEPNYSSEHVRRRRRTGRRGPAAKSDGGFPATPTAAKTTSARWKSPPTWLPDGRRRQSHLWRWWKAIWVEAPPGRAGLSAGCTASITDACIGWATPKPCSPPLADGVKARRAKLASRGRLGRRINCQAHSRARWQNTRVDQSGRHG